MRIYDDIPSRPLSVAGRAVGIGVFDGVHLGHQELIRRVVTAAQNSGLKPLLFTFDRHPLELLNPSDAPPYLTPLEDKLSLMEQAGAEEVVVAKLTPQLLSTEAEDFVRQVMVERLNTRWVVAGWSFRFGKGRRGTPEMLRQIGAELGFRTDVVQPVTVDGEVATSSRIRELLACGRLAVANRLLGRPHSITGKVVRGRGRGRTIGVPTANLEIPYRAALPSRGVYKAEAVVGCDGYPAVVNIGLRPTFNEEPVLTVEAHLIGFRGDLYGRSVRLRFLERLRDERKFDSVEALKHQLAEDIERALGER